MPQHLIPATVTGADAAGLAVEFAGGHRIVVPVETGRAGPGDKVDVGIRPENLHLGRDIPMRVNVLERLGGVSITYGAMPDGHRLCAALPGDAPVREGEEVWLTFSPADAHVFDASGAVLRRLKAPALAA